VKFRRDELDFGRGFFSTTDIVERFRFFQIAAEFLDSVSICELRGAVEQGSGIVASRGANAEPLFFRAREVHRFGRRRTTQQTGQLRDMEFLIPDASKDKQRKPIRFHDEAEGVFLRI
jgi:hypothetical protein